MKKLLYIILGFFIYQSSFSQQKEVLFLDINFMNVNDYVFNSKSILGKKVNPTIRTGKRITWEARAMIQYYVDFERDLNGNLINEVKLYKARRNLSPITSGLNAVKRRGTLVGSGYLSKINTSNFTLSIFKEKWQEFYLNGNTKKIIPFDNNGIKNGIYEEYFEDGELYKKIDYVNGEIINTEHNINLKYNLRYFSDEDYIKAYIEKDGIDTFEGIYDCEAHIPIRGTNLKGTYKIAIVNYKDHPSLLSNYKAYILRADCSDCSEWEIGDVLAFFRETKSGRYHIYWNHPANKYENEDNIKIAINFGSKKYMQVFNTEVIFSNSRLIFNIESEYIKDKSPKEFYDDESVTLDRIWPKSNIDTSSINNQEIDSSKDTNITREKAIVLLKELKELLDLGILTQEEFDKKVVSLKKIILEDNYPH